MIPAHWPHEAVPGAGPVPCNLMAIGEAPGRDEYKAKRPFVGLSGQQFNWYLRRRGLDLAQFYLTNVNKEYADHNPDPTPEQVELWTPTLEFEIQQVQPKVILAVGRYAAEWFGVYPGDMDSIHGLPHRGGEFDPSRRDRAQGAVIIPVYHPAYGLHNQTAKTLIESDMGRAAEVIRLVLGGHPELVQYRHDPYAGQERYEDVTGAELAAAIAFAEPARVGFDTEGTPEEPWSLQISWQAGTAYVLRCSQSDFAIGVEALQRLADSGCVFITHDAGTPRGTGYDTQVARTCGLELHDANHANTMYRAYLLRTEPRGLKALAYRWCGIKMQDYMSLIGDIGRGKQIQYLEKVAAKKDWERIPPRVERENNGVLKVKKFGKLESRAKKILTDIAKDKRNKDGEPVDPKARWEMLEPELRALAEKDPEFGKLPVGTLDDVDLAEAIHYAGADASATLRLDRVLEEECQRIGVEGVNWTGMQVLPIFEDMQYEGMPASRKAFVDLATEVEKEMSEIQAGLSANWFGGQPFNPAPNTKDVEILVRRLGITGLKTSKKSGRPSTSMKSLEHLGSRYPAIAQVGEWRRRQKVLDTYCLPMIEIADKQFATTSRPLDGQSDLFLVHWNLKPVTVETRRLAAEGTALNQPVRTDLGRKVRSCYMTVLEETGAEDEEVFGEWDFNSQEVRVTASITGDRLLCAIMCDPSRKIHMETASRIFGKPIEDIHEINEKIPAKTAFFGMLYGLSGMGLLDLFRSFGAVKVSIEMVQNEYGQWQQAEVRREWALDDCEKLIAEIFNMYPGLQETIRAVELETIRLGYVRDLYGHIRYLPGIWSQNRAEQAEARRQAFSHLIQSTAQGVTQNAMAALRWPIRDMQKAKLNVRWTLQQHDALLFRFSRWLFPVMDRLVVDAMQNKHGGPSNVRFRVPILADGHMSTRWDSLKG